MGVLVSRNGFSNAARHKAKRTGIKLLQADRLSSLSLPIPIYVRELRVSSVRIALDAKEVSLREAAPDIITEVTDFDFAKGFRLFLLDGIDADLPVTVIDLKLHNMRRFSITAESGDTFDFDTRYFRCDVEEHHFFGLLGDISEALSLYDRARNHATVLVSVDLFDFRAQFAQFSSREDLPLTPLLTLDVLAVPVDLFEGTLEWNPPGLMFDGPPSRADEVVTEVDALHYLPRRRM